MMFTDMTAKEELLTILPMKEHTQGEDIFQSLKKFIEKTQHPVCKLVSITTDGAPIMVGRVNGLLPSVGRMMLSPISSITTA